MDTSQKYLRMCEKAEEMRKLWNPETGDLTGLKVGSDGVDLCLLVLKNEKCDFVPYREAGEFREVHRAELKTEERIVWIPRQDQLQNLVVNNPIDGTKELHSFVTTDGPDYARKFDSFEKLWLAFVMKRKYRKLWNTVRWIEEN
ncbi:hypothetical protein E3J62_01320 [candidate division TA06 bacterium]|uniref:Uncharacterized protein n=1 Tax=candidate division TA06 bacterium TaxID=2250710 RepID=A0A523UY90_UNCT6|nr:MAG: hypothetical protein E3J62_01320 [candidate division TA06 bacterium]